MICNLEISKLLFEVCQPSTPNYKHIIVNFLYNWQTLLAGSFALIGGGLLAAQIRIQKKDIKQKQKQRLTAARMRLPHALSEIHRYLDQVYLAWRDKDTKKLDHLSQTTLDCIIENGSLADAKTFVCLSNLVRFLQISEARLSDESPFNYYDIMLIDMARLKHLVDRLYPYGRFKADVVMYITPTREDLERELLKPTWVFKLQDDDPIHERIKETLNNKFGRKQ